MTAAGTPDLARAAEELGGRLPEPLAPLARLAYNYRWSWAPGGADLFEEIDPVRFERARENPVRLLQEAHAADLDRAAADRGLVARAQAAERELAAALAEPAAVAAATPANPIAFLCAEFGVHRSLPIYSGGLGVLAGDVLKEASDRRLPMVGIGLLYARGNFHQRIDPEGNQQEYWLDVDPERLPAALVTDGDGRPLTVRVPVRDREVLVQVWRVDVGRVPLFLLDADRPENDEPSRFVTDRLYVGDPHVRIEQYALLGVGGVLALRALGIEPAAFHLNEGHAAFAPLELARERIAQGVPVEEALRAAADRTAFTTHTPVAAGNETYPLDEVVDVLGPRIGIEHDRLLALGATDDARAVGTTALGLRLSRSATAVSHAHEAVARRMWQPLFPGRGLDEVPIGHVTNGVHVPTWMHPSMRELLDRYLGESWVRRADDPTSWAGVEAVPDEELWALRNRLRALLVAHVRRADVGARLARHEPAEAVKAALAAFDPDALTLGFARRVALYKRLYLLFQEPERLERVLRGPRAVQLVIAGKAHPGDPEAKGRLAELLHRTWPLDVAPRIAYLEDYDMGVAARMVAGCDVWLNLPRPPLEASGTSGMKAALNGSLHLSTVDGWWAEGADGENGWSLGTDAAGGDVAEQDRRGTAALFDLLEGEVVPLFHERDADGIPRGWLRRVKRSLATIGPRFGASRMLADYERLVYANAVRVPASGT